MKKTLKNVMHKTFVFATLFIVIRLWVENETLKVIINKLALSNVIIFIAATLYFGIIVLVEYLKDENKDGGS